MRRVLASTGFQTQFANTLRPRLLWFGRSVRHCFSCCEECLFPSEHFELFKALHWTCWFCVWRLILILCTVWRSCGLSRQRFANQKGASALLRQVKASNFYDVKCMFAAFLSLIWSPFFLWNCVLHNLISSLQVQALCGKVLAWPWGDAGFHKIIYVWLVVCNMFFPYIGNNDPNWFSYSFMLWSWGWCLMSEDLKISTAPSWAGQIPEKEVKQWAALYKARTSFNRFNRPWVMHRSECQAGTEFVWPAFTSCQLEDGGHWWMSMSGRKLSEHGQSIGKALAKFGKALALAKHWQSCVCDAFQAYGPLMVTLTSKLSKDLRWSSLCSFSSCYGIERFQS